MQHADTTNVQVETRSPEVAVLRMTPIKGKAFLPAKRLTHEQMIEYAEKHQPPQAWYDQTEDPFEPRKRS